MYATLLGFNAVAVPDADKGITIRLIPIGWGPAKLQLGKDEKERLVITCPSITQL